GTYRVPRFTDVPRIDVVLVERPDVAPAGAGETPMIAVAPALANAIFEATGVRLRALPLIPDGVVRGPGFLSGRVAALAAALEAAVREEARTCGERRTLWWAGSTRFSATP